MNVELTDIEELLDKKFKRIIDIFAYLLAHLSRLKMPL